MLTWECHYYCEVSPNGLLVISDDVHCLNPEDKEIPNCKAQHAGLDMA